MYSLPSTWWMMLTLAGTCRQLSCDFHVPAHSVTALQLVNDAEIGRNMDEILRVLLALQVCSAPPGDLPSACHHAGAYLTSIERLILMSCEA